MLASEQQPAAGPTTEKCFCCYKRAAGERWGEGRHEDIKYNNSRLPLLKEGWEKCSKRLLKPERTNITSKAKRTQLASPGTGRFIPWTVRKTKGQFTARRDCSSGTVLWVCQVKIVCLLQIRGKGGIFRQGFFGPGPLRWDGEAELLCTEI